MFNWRFKFCDLSGFNQFLLCPCSLSLCVYVAFLLTVQTWNSVGIVTQYNTEEEESIDIEFHDSATHHAMHISNALGHTMADLSAEAALLATEADEDNPRSGLLFGRQEALLVMSFEIDTLEVSLGNLGKIPVKVLR